MARMLLLYLLAAIATVSGTESTGYRLLNKVFTQCEKSEDFTKCLKLQALKAIDRAVHSSSITLIDGISVVLENTGRSMPMENLIPENKLQDLESNEIDGLLVDKTERFLQNHQVKLDLPKLVEEGRAKMKKMMGMMMAMMALKGGMMVMAMKGIAMMAMSAMMIGKLALILSAIIGLKKLLGGGGQEKTTVEIVKHPQVSYGNSYSNGYDDGGYGSGGGGGGGGGPYHRSLSPVNDMLMQEKAYRAHVPKVRRRR